MTEWKDLLNPKYKGKAAILDVPAIGIMDAALCFESADLIKYGNKGNMTTKEIDFTIEKLIELKKSGHFRATWTTFDQSVQLMAAGEVVIQSMWSPAVAAVRVKQIPCVYAPVNKKGDKEGYRGWCNGLGLMKHLSGKKLDAAYEYINWYYSGWQGAFVSRYGYYSPVPSTAKKQMTRPNGRSGTKASRRRKRSRIRTAFRWKRPAPSATAAPSWSASRISRAGTR